MSGDYLKVPVEYKPTWEHRRKTIFRTLACDMAALWFCLIASVLLARIDQFEGPISVFMVTVVVAVIGRGVLVIGSYVFGAAWDDRNFMNMLSGLRGGGSEGGGGNWGGGHHHGGGPRHYADEVNDKGKDPPPKDFPEGEI